MYAEIGRNTLDLQHLPSREVVQQMQAVLAEQPGYCGYLAVETGAAQRIFIRLWDSAAAAEAASKSAAVRAFVAAHVTPAIIQREILGQGPVIHYDFSRTASA